MNENPEKKINGLIIKIERENCISTGNCIKVAPDVFEFDNEKICSFKKDIPASAEKGRLIEACSVCPVSVLSAIDEDGKQIVP